MPGEKDQIPKFEETQEVVPTFDETVPLKKKAPIEEPLPGVEESVLGGLSISEELGIKPVQPTPRWDYFSQTIIPKEKPAEAKHIIPEIDEDAYMEGYEIMTAEAATTGVALPPLPQQILPEDPPTPPPTPELRPTGEPITAELREAKEEWQLRKEKIEDLPYVLKAGYNQSLVGTVQEILSGDKPFNVEDYDPSTLEEIGAIAVGFFMDSPFLMVTGGVGGAAVKAGIQQGIKVAGKQATKQLVRGGVPGEIAERIVKLGMKRNATKISKFAGMAEASGTSGTALGSYGAAHETLRQMSEEDRSLHELEAGEILKEGLINFTLGVGLGVTGAGIGLGEVAIKEAGLGAIEKTASIVGLRTAGFGAEVGIFTLGDKALRGHDLGSITSEDWANSVKMVLGAKIAHVPAMVKKYLKGKKGELELSDAELRRLNSKAENDVIDKTKDMTDLELVDFLKDPDIPLTTKDKVLYATRGIYPEAIQEIRGVSVTTEEGKSVVNVTNKDGLLLDTKEYNNKVQAETEALKLIEIAKENELLDKVEALDVDQKYEIQEQLEDVGALKEALAKSVRTPKDKQLIKKYIEVVDDVLKVEVEKKEVKEVPEVVEEEKRRVEEKVEIDRVVKETEEFLKKEGREGEMTTKQIEDFYVRQQERYNKLKNQIDETTITEIESRDATEGTKLEESVGAIRDKRTEQRGIEDIKRDPEIPDIKLAEQIRLREEVDADINKVIGEEYKEVLPEEKPIPPKEEAEKKRQFAIDMVETGQIPVKEPMEGDGRTAETQPRVDYEMSGAEKYKAVNDIKKGNLETAPAKKLIEKLEEFYEQGGLPIIEGTGGKAIRERGIPLKEQLELIEEAKREKVEKKPERPAVEVKKELPPEEVKPSLPTKIRTAISDIKEGKTTPKESGIVEMFKELQKTEPETFTELQEEYKPVIEEYKAKQVELEKAERGEAIKKAEAGISEALDDITTAIGGKASIMAEKRPDVIKALKNLVKNIAIKYELKGEELYKRVKAKIEEVFKEKFYVDFFDENRAEIMGERKKLEVETAKKFVKEFDKQTKEKIQSPIKKLVSKIFKKQYLTEKFFDDKAYAKRQLEIAGAKEAIWKKNITLGSSGESKIRMKEMQEEVFGSPFKNKLTTEERNNLDKIILFRRTVTLDNYKDGLKKELESLHAELREKGLKMSKDKKKEITDRIDQIKERGTERLRHTVLKINGKDVALTKELAETWLNSLKEESPEQYKKLDERADKYFKSNKELLKDRLDEGLIDQDTYERLEVFDYSKRMFVERMLDAELMKGGGFYTDAEIKALKEGSTDLLYDNAEFLLQQNVASTTRLVFENRANKALGEFFNKNETDFGKQQDPIGINKTTGEPKYPKVPTGWKEITYKDKGKEKRIVVTADFFNSWTAKDPIIKQSAARALQWATAVKPIKFFATGVNPFFALYNFIRDPGHVYFFTDTYSPFLPKAMMQMGKDLFTVAKDSWTTKGRYRDYAREGGMMDFLTTQGVSKVPLPQTNIGEATNVAVDIASKLNHTSETIVRLAVRERAIKDLTDAFIKKNGRNPIAEEIKKIQEESTGKGRATMDFSQKGEWVRAADNFFPYLAASFQGLNVAARAFRQRPLGTSARVAQGIGLVVGATLYNMQWNDEDEKKGVMGYEHVPDYIKSVGQPLMLPFTTTDREGNKVRPYVIIPIPHEFSIFKTTTESITEWAATGEFKGKPITKSLNIAIPLRSPVDVPIVDAIIAYELGYDRFRDKQIWKDAKMKAEAEFTAYTPEIYKDIGKATGMSPDRMKMAAGKMFTSHEGNIYSIALAAGYEGVKNLLETDKEKKEYNDLAVKSVEDMLTPLQKRFYRYPNKKQKEKDIIEEAEIAENTKRKLEEKDKIYEYILNYRKASDTERKEIEKDVRRFANDMEKKSTGARSRILTTFNKSKKTTTIESRFIINLLYVQIPEVRARAFFEVWKESSDEKRKDLKRDARRAGIITDDLDSRFNKEFRKLKIQK